MMLIRKLRTSGLRLRRVAGGRGVGREVNSLKGVGAAQPYGWVSCIVAYVFGEAPAVFAFAACGGFGLNVEGSFGYLSLGDDGVGKVDLGYAEEFGKNVFITPEDWV